MRTSVPIVSVSIVGSEEIHPVLGRLPWVIEVGEAITTDELPPGAADDPVVVFDVTDQVRDAIQQTLCALLVQRRGTFF
ncbi:MAG: hypothetical protein ACRYG2_23260 [Janthinobacterium lividum]